MVFCSSPRSYNFSVTMYFFQVKRKSSETAIPLSKVSLTSERQIRLTSVKNLCKAIDQKEHLGLKNLLNEHKFVGCVNRTLALVQHLTQLYLVNTQKLTQELFYQILIFKFGNFGYIELSEAAPIYELVLLALNSPESGWSPEDGSKEDLAKYATDLLMNKAEMLLDYFSVEINKNGELTAVPLLLDNYIPNWNGLPMLLLRLATEVSLFSIHMTTHFPPNFCDSFRCVCGILIYICLRTNVFDNMGVFRQNCSSITGAKKVLLI